MRISDWSSDVCSSDLHHIAMALRAGPFKRLEGHWRFHALDESACKVTLTLDFEPQSRLLAPAMALGFQGLADRMVDDFVRVADRGAECCRRPCACRGSAVASGKAPCRGRGGP